MPVKRARFSTSISTQPRIRKIWGKIKQQHTLTIHNGDVAQMVERVLSMHEAQGSIPCFSTFLVLFLHSAPLALSKGGFYVIFF